VRVGGGERAGRGDHPAGAVDGPAGLRACDIIALRLGDIDWRGQTIGIVQQKTGNPLTLPLPALVLGKLAGYVLEERPGSADDHVFLRSVAPHTRLAGHSSVHVVTAAVFRKAGAAHKFSAPTGTPRPRGRVSGGSQAT
jgi:integrase